MKAGTRMNWVISPLQRPRTRPRARTAASTAGAGQSQVLAMIPETMEASPTT